MLYVFYGTDIEASRKKAKTLTDSLRAKKPDAAYEVIDADHWDVSILEGHMGGQGLFSNKYIVFLNRLTENAEAKENLSDYIEALHESTNIFIMLEAKVLADLKKKLEKFAEKIVVTDLPESSKAAFKKEEFKVFDLADALGAKDSFKMWSLYRTAVETGLESESILGTLFWQVKSMILADNARSAAEVGLNPFVFSKSKKYAGNFSGDALHAMLEKIITVYHDGHRGLTNMELAIEKFMLTGK